MNDSDNTSTSKRMGFRVRALPSDNELFEQAHRLFEYHQDGTLTFRIDPRFPQCLTSKMVGKNVGGDDGHGYLMCLLMGHKFKVHQIVWLMHYGETPKNPIDHTNRRRKDNRIENLRVASDLQNMQNLTISTAATAGTSKSPISGRYLARVTYKGKKIYLGYFDTAEEANAAYAAEKKRLAGEFSPV